MLCGWTADILSLERKEKSKRNKTSCSSFMMHLKMSSGLIRVIYAFLLFVIAIYVLFVFLCLGAWFGDLFSFVFVLSCLFIVKLCDKAFVISFIDHACLHIFR